MTPEKTTSNLEGYQEMMHEIARRLEVISCLVAEDCSTGYNTTDIEAIALNFRKIAELVVYANLIGHEEEHDIRYPKSRYDWRIERIVERIKSINPQYYPQALLEVIMEDDETSLYDTVEPLPPGAWMDESGLLAMYNECSDLIHTQNPFSKKADYFAYLAKFDTWAKGLIGLLSYHIVHLADGKDSIWCIMSPDGGDVPSVRLMAVLEDGDDDKDSFKQVSE